MVDIQRLRAESKVSGLCEQIRQMALALEPGAKLPTVNELCNQLETSRVTLTEVLRILERQQVIYRQQSKGIFVSPHLHRKHIGILFDTTNFIFNGASSFWGMLWGLLAKEVRHRESQQNLYHSFHTSFRTDQHIQVPEDFHQLVLENRLHGALLIGIFENEIRLLQQQGIHCVSFAGYGPFSVELDMVEFVRMAVRKIVEQHCQRLDFWIPAFMDNGHPELNDLFSRVQVDRGLIFDQVRVKTGAESLTLQEQGYQIAMDVFGQNRHTAPDGIVILDDLMTDGILAAFQVLGVRLGEDVHVVTHANAGSMIFFNAIPGMMVLEFDPADIVSSMFTLLDMLLSGQTPPTTQVKIFARFRPNPGTHEL